MRGKVVTLLLAMLEDAMGDCVVLKGITGGLYTVALELQDKDISQKLCC